MRKVDHGNEKIALKVLTSAFKGNAGVLAVVKKDSRIDKRSAELCYFCLTVSRQKNGAFISEDQKGVALIFKNWKRQTPLNWLKGYIRLGQKCIGWGRALKIIRRERTIQSKRPKNKHLYFWMLAVEDHTYGLETIKQMRDFVYTYSKNEQLPIYAETMSEKTLTLYQRYGFEVYDKWQENENGPVVYFIARDWDA